MKFLVNLGQIGLGVLVGFLSGLASLVKPPTEKPALAAAPKPIETLDIQAIEAQPVLLTPTEEESLAVAETIETIAQLQQSHPAPVVDVPKPEETPGPVATEVLVMETAAPEAIAQFVEESPAAAPVETTSTVDTKEPAEKPETTTLKSRAEQIYEILDTAWAEGNTSYSKLISAVREATGKGCSRAKIAAWKKDRGLINA